MTTPSEKLAAIVSERFVKENLIRKKDADKLVAKLASGDLEAADWRLIFEQLSSLPKGERNEK